MFEQKESEGKPSELSLKTVLESMDKDIDYYRKMLLWLYTYSLAAQILIITVKNT